MGTLGFGLIVGFCVVSILALKYLKSHREGKKTDLLMSQLAQSAVADTQVHFGVSLDYTSQSIQELEKSVFPEFQKQYEKEGFTDEILQKGVLALGAYVGEVFRQNQKATWRMDPKAAREKVLNSNSLFLVTASGQQMNVCVWAHKRIQKGPEESVWGKYEAGLLLSQGTVDFPRDGILWREWNPQTVKLIHERNRPVLLFVANPDPTVSPFLKGVLAAMPSNGKLQELLDNYYIALMVQAGSVPELLRELGAGTQFHIAILSPAGLTPMATINPMEGKPREIVATITLALEKLQKIY